MSRVMPSQVIQTIDELFPHAAKGGGDGQLQAGHSPQLSGIISLVKAVPPELISVSSQDYADLVLATSTIEMHLGIWTSRGPTGGMASVKGSDAISVIRRVLARCPDEYPLLHQQRNSCLSKMMNCAKAFAATQELRIEH